MDSLWFSIYEIMLIVLIPSQSGCFLSHFLAQLSQLIPPEQWWIEEVKADVVACSWSRAKSLSQLSMTCGFFIECTLSDFGNTPNLLNIFITERVSKSIKYFYCVCWSNYVVSALYSIGIVSEINWFSDTKPTLHFRIMIVYDPMGSWYILLTRGLDLVC